MSQSIYQLLSQYQYTPDTEQDFIRDLKKFQDQINTMDYVLGTPITHYCTTHLNSGISLFVLRTLVISFNADVNINANNKIPLSVVLGDQDDNNFKKNTEIFEFLYRYTNIQSLIVNGNPRLLVLLLLKLSDHITETADDLINQIKILKKYHAPFNNLILDNELQILNVHLLKNLLNLDVEERIKAFIRCMNCLESVNPNDLLHQATHVGNLVLINTLFKIYPLNIKPNVISMKHLNIADIISTTTFVPDNTHIIHPLVSQQVTAKHNDQFIVICNSIIHVPSLVGFESDGFNSGAVRDKVESIGYDIVETYLQDRDLNKALASFGFENNMFHLFALTNKNNPYDYWDTMYRYHPNMITDINMFGQSPIKIALLANNQDFILFFANTLISQRIHADVIDNDKNTIWHVVARVPLSDDDLSFIIRCFSKIENIASILKATNKFNQSPIHIAILSCNYVFIHWWDSHGGAFDLIDQDHKTVWYYFSEIYFNSNNALAIDFINNIYRILNSRVAHLVHTPNKEGIIPIHVAMLNPPIFQLLLHNEHNQGRDFALTHRDNEGNTISHLLSMLLAEDIFYHRDLSGVIKIVKMLIPYKHHIAQNYKIKNNNNDRPLDILETGIDKPLPLWLHHKVSHSILQKVSVMLDVINDDRSSIISINDQDSDHIPVSSNIPITRIILQNQPVKIDNRLIFFLPKVLDLVSKVSNLDQYTQDLINALSFEIAYSDVNEFGDTTLHYLVSVTLLEVDNENTALHIFNILDPNIKQVVSEAKNHLGQYLSHIAIQSDFLRFFSTQWNYDNSIIAQIEQIPSQEIMEKFNIQVRYTRLYPYDYAVILQNRHALIYLQILETRMKATMPSNLRSLIPNIKEHELIDYINVLRSSKSDDNTDYLLNRMAPQHERIKNLLLGNDNIKITLARVATLQGEYSYFPTHHEHLSYLQYSNNLLLDEEGFEYVYSLNHLRKTLSQYKILLHGYTKNTARRLKSIAMTYDMHASCLVILKDMSNKFHVLIHDSTYTTIPGVAYTKRFNEITKVLLEVLQMDKNDIHELQVHQQGRTKFNCGLWTIANIKILQMHLLTSKENSFLCIALKPRLSLIDYSTNNVLQNIEQSMLDDAPKLVEACEKLLTKCHNNNYKNLQHLSYTFEKLFNMVVRDNININDKSELMIPEAKNSYLTVPLSDQNIRNIIDVKYHGKFAIYPLSEDYNNSDHALIVLDNPLISDALAHHLHMFVEEKQKILKARTQNPYFTHTSIINKDGDHWVVLVVALNELRAEVYFIDSYGYTMPDYIKSIVQVQLQDYHGIDIYDQIVTIKQQENNYDCGLWAIENAVYIHTMFSQDEELSWLRQEIELNIIADRATIRDMRIIFQNEILEDAHDYIIPPPNAFEGFKEYKEQIGLTAYISRCDMLDSVTGHNRKKRAICQDEDIEPSLDNINQFRLTTTRLYFNIAYLAALQDINDNNRFAKILNTLKYIGSIYDIFAQPSQYYSAREDSIIKQHYNNINALISPDSKKHFLALVQDDNNHKSPIIFYNDYSTIIVSDAQNHYLIYSQNLNYERVYKTKDEVSWSAIIKFVELFFKLYSGQESLYNKYIIADNLYTRNAITQLENSYIWQQNDVIQSDLEILLKSDGTSIDNIPIKIIHKIFLLNGKVPDVKILNDNFFSTNHLMLSLRIDQIHKAFLYLDPEQLKSLKKLINEYKFPLDTTYLSKILSTKNHYIQFLVSGYHTRMMQKLKNIDTLTLPIMEQLTWEMFDDFMKLHDSISPELRKVSIQNMQTLYKLLVHHMQLHKNQVTPALFFMPELIKSVNYKDFTLALYSAAMISGDMTLNKLYISSFNKMAPHLDPRICKIIQRLPVTNPIFKVLTAYAIKNLSDQLSTMDPTSKEYEIISHKLKEEYATVGLMVVEFFNVELTPLWFVSMLETVYYEGHQISILYNLDLPAWQETLMGLGFYQDKTRTLITESSIISYNLEFVDKITHHFLNQNNSSLYIIKIPKLGSEHWQIVDEYQVPEKIKQSLHFKLRTHAILLSSYQAAQLAAGSPYTDPFVSVTINGYSLTTYDRQKFQYKYHSYNALRSNTKIIFDDYHLDKYKESGSQDEVFIDQIKLSNQTWLRLPQKYGASCLPWPLYLLYCHAPERSFVLRETDYTALYYNGIHKNIKNSIWDNIKNIIFVFDPREGNITLRFTKEYAKVLGTNVDYYVSLTVFVQYKSYPATLSFHDDNPSLFELCDETHHMIMPKYFIMDNNSSFIIADNADVRSIITVPTTYLNNTPRYTIITGTSNSISFHNTDDANKSYHDSTIVSLKYKKRLDISLGINYFIGAKLELSDKTISINHLQGYANNAIISFTGNNSAFHLKLAGNIIVDDANQSRLYMAGHYQDQLSSYSKSYNHYQDCMNYHMIVADFRLAFYTIQRLQTANYTQHIEFKDMNDINYNWYKKQSSGYLYIHDNKTSECTLSLSRQHDTLSIKGSDSQALEYFMTIHYNGQLKLDNNEWVLKTIFISSNNSFEVSDIIQDIQNIHSLSKCNLISSAMNGSIILLQSKKGYYHWYNMFPFDRNININFINYHIMEDGICYIPSEYTNSNEHTNILEYMVHGSYFDTRIVSSCTNDSDKVQIRATRHIFQDNENHITNFSTKLNIFNKPNYSKDDQVDYLNKFFVNDNTVNYLAQNLDYDNNTIIIEEYLEFNNDNYSNIEFTNHISNQRSAGSRLNPPGYELIKKIWEYCFPKENNILIHENVDVTDSIVNSNVNLITNTNDTNITEHLQLNYNSDDNQTQHLTHVLNVHGTLIAVQWLSHWLFGKNKLLSVSQYISPEQKRNILVQNIAEECLTILNNNTYDDFNHEDYCNSAPSWYNDMYII